MSLSEPARSPHNFTVVFQMPASQKDLDAFRYMVREAIRLDSQTIIENTNSEHAKVILEELFAAAKTSIFVFCGCLSAAAWGSQTMAENIQAAFARGVKITFVVGNPDKIPSDSPTANVLHTHSGTILSSPSFANMRGHFAVFDSKRYRFELDDGACKAVVCMNDSDFGAKLTELGSCMERVSTPVS